VEDGGIWMSQAVAIHTVVNLQFGGRESLNGWRPITLIVNQQLRKIGWIPVKVLPTELIL
jgi:hypothetical protein